MESLENCHNFIRHSYYCGKFFLYNTLYFKGGSFSLPWGTPVFYDDGDYVSAQGSWISDSSNGIIAEQKLTRPIFLAFNHEGFA